MRAEPQGGRPNQWEHPTAQKVILRTRDGNALCTSSQTVRNGDDGFDSYLKRVTINGDENVVAWHSTNFMMAYGVPRLDELMDWLHERLGRTSKNSNLIQLGFMDPDHPEDDPAYAKKWRVRRIVYESGKEYIWESNCF